VKLKLWQSLALPVHVEAQFCDAAHSMASQVSATELGW